MGAPGWPERAFWTESMARKRRVLMHSWSRAGSVNVFPCAGGAGRLPDAADGCRRVTRQGTAGVLLRHRVWYPIAANLSSTGLMGILGDLETGPKPGMAGFWGYSGSGGRPHPNPLPEGEGIWGAGAGIFAEEIWGRYCVERRRAPFAMRPSVAIWVVQAGTRKSPATRGRGLIIGQGIRSGFRRLPLVSF